jgi:hypothetical protein
MSDKSQKDLSKQNQAETNREGQSFKKKTAMTLSVASAVVALLTGLTLADHSLLKPLVESAKKQVTSVLRGDTIKSLPGQLIIASSNPAAIGFALQHESHSSHSSHDSHSSHSSHRSLAF